MSKASQIPSVWVWTLTKDETSQTHTLGLKAPGPLPRLSKFMQKKRDLIRWFIRTVAWATPSNVAYFVEGRCDQKIYRAYSSELAEMLRVKDSSLRLRRIKNQDDKHAYTLTAKILPTFLFNHDVCVRNVIGKFLHRIGRQKVSFEKPADATILQYRFEMDNGHMNEKQLREKLLTHYVSQPVQVIFIMRHREFPDLEAERLLKVMRISVGLFPEEPNKVLGACYGQFLENGKIYNRKGEAKIEG